MKGCFLVFEGPEGAGKSLQIGRLAERLSQSGMPHMVTREPGGTAAAEAIRSVLLDRPELRLDGIAELLLFSASRRVHDEEVVTRAATGGLLPDLYLVLDIPVKVGLGRQWQDREDPGQLAFFGPAPDRIEMEKRSFRERVREGYREFAAAEERIVVVDGSGTPEEVEGRVLGLLEERVPDRFRGANFPR